MNRKTIPSLDTNGHYWIDECGGVWRQVSYCGEPTATLQNVENGTRVGGACAAPIFDRFTHLIRDESAA